MKILKRIFFTILALLVICIVFRGTLYRHIVTYKSIGQRTTYVVTNDKLIRYIEENCIEKDNKNIEEIIKESLSLTSKALNFTFSKNDRDPNRLIDSKTANCIGYAAFFTAVCDYQLKKYNLSDQWIVSSEIGQIFVFGTNIHNYFDSSFFKDHDFVIVKNKTTKEIFAVDPSINDYLCIDYITFDNYLK